MASKRHKRDEGFDWDEEDAPSKDGENRFVLHELGQIAPSVPIRWIEVEDMPYLNPQDEYIRSPFPVDLIILCQRWEGLWKTHQIEADYATGEWNAKRFQYQEDLEKTSIRRSLVGDSRYQTKVIDDELYDLDSEIARLKSDLAQGIEYRAVKGAGAFGYVKMPMTVASKTQISNQLIKLRQYRRLVFGLATQISDNKHEHTFSLAEEMRKLRAEKDPGYKDNLKKAGLDGVLYETPQLEEGKEIWDVIPRALDLPIEAHMIEDRTE